jgi:hypothetical protein
MTGARRFWFEDEIERPWVLSSSISEQWICFTKAMRHDVIHDLGTGFGGSSACGREEIIGEQFGKAFGWDGMHEYLAYLST